MLWSPKKTYFLEPFDTEAEFEKAIIECSDMLFGKSRIYIDMKKLIGKKGETQNIPDGYLIDLTSSKEPKLYVVENELSKHDPLKHIAVQILKFSLSFESSIIQIKTMLKEKLSGHPEHWKICEEYVRVNSFENVDIMLEKMLYGENAFNALVVIDETHDELETVLINRFNFPVDVITLQRYKTDDGSRLYSFEPFLSEVGSVIEQTKNGKHKAVKTIDTAEIDTIVVPAQEDGFQETFIGENCWYAVRIHSSMIPKIKYIAAYRVSPESAITHIAEVKEIKQWKKSNKYIINFSGKAWRINPIRLIPKGKIKAPQSARYASYSKLKKAKTMEDAF